MRSLFIVLCLAIVALSTIEAQLCTEWSKPVNHSVFTGGILRMAADPSVIYKDNKFMMYFTTFDGGNDYSFIGVAESSDGVTGWNYSQPYNDEDKQYFTSALLPRPGEWDTYLETAHVIQHRSGEWWMYYTGYVPNNVTFNQLYRVGLARSSDGLNWTRVSDGPILGEAECNCDSLTSPSVVEHEGRYYMVGLRWVYSNNKTAFGSFGLHMYESNDGISGWRDTTGKPILPATIPGAEWIGARIEPTFMKGSDGVFYLYITADTDGRIYTKSTITVLTANSPRGPYTACRSPQVQMTLPFEEEEIIAPTVYEDREAGKLRMWYHGLRIAGNDIFQIGYAEVNMRLTPVQNVTTTGDSDTSPGSSLAFPLSFLL